MRSSIRQAMVWRALIVAAVFATAGAAEAAPSSAPYLPSPDPCLLVKNFDARQNCHAAREEYYRGRYTGAMALINKAIAASPKEGVLHTVQAFIMLRFNAVGPAEQQLRQARKDGAPDHIILPQLWTVMIRRHEETILLNEFPEPAAGAKGQVTSDILQGRARALLSLERLPEAAAAMDRSLSLNRDADGLLVRSEIALKQNDVALADKLVDEAYKLEPKTVQVMGAKLKRLQRANDNAGVLALADQMIELYPIYSNAVTVKVETYIKLNQDAKAKAALDAYSSVRTKSAVVYYYRAVLAWRAKDKKGAAQLIQTLPIQFARDNPEYALQMAQIVLDNGNVESAASILGAGLGGAPDQVDLRLKLAGIRFGQNSPQSALLVLTPIQDSKDPRVQTMLKQVRAKIAKDRAF